MDDGCDGFFFSLLLIYLLALQLAREREKRSKKELNREPNQRESDVAIIITPAAVFFFFIARKTSLFVLPPVPAFQLTHRAQDAADGRVLLR